jgi:hypothetical protein
MGKLRRTFQHTGNSCDRYGFRAGAPTRSSKCASSECPPWAPLEHGLSAGSLLGNKPCIIRLIMVPPCLARMTSIASSLEPSSASDGGTCASICWDLRHLLELNAAPCLIRVCRLSSAAEVLCDHFNGKPHVRIRSIWRIRCIRHAGDPAVPAVALQISLPAANPWHQGKQSLVWKLPC